MIKQQNSMKDMFHQICSQAVRVFPVKVIKILQFLIPPARPFVMISKGNKVPVNGDLRSQELHPCSDHLKTWTQ